MSDVEPTETTPRDNQETTSAASLDDVVNELRAQNALLERQLTMSRQHGYRTSIVATACSVFLGMVLFWAVAQTDWGAKHFAMPVKFFVDSGTAGDLGLDDTSSDSTDTSSDGPADPGDPYATDGYCEPGTYFEDNDDVDCDYRP